MKYTQQAQLSKYTVASLRMPEYPEIREFIFVPNATRFCNVCANPNANITRLAMREQDLFPDFEFRVLRGS